jgi:SAM-dependent methyltransferase
LRAYREIPVNENHRKLCPSPEWAEYIEGEVLPSLDALVEWGEAMLEIGPGPGAATECLRHRAKRLVVLEIDEEAAQLLSARFAGTNVEVVIGDAATLQFEDCAFDSVGTFTMLHHVPTLQLQQMLIAEAFRVLRPGGVLAGSDSLASAGLHEFHARDTYNPIEPSTLLALLRGLGFCRITLIVDNCLQFVAHKPVNTSD